MARNNEGILPEDYLQTKAARRTNVICLTLFGVVMVGVVAAWFVTKGQWARVHDQRQQVNERYQDAARRIDQLDKLQDRKSQMIRKAKLTSALVEKFPRTLILSELINHMPATLGLLDFELETKELRNTSRPRTALQRRRQESANKRRQRQQLVELKPTQVDIHLVGVAPTDVEVSTFIGRLNAHSMFRDVNLKFSEETEIEGQGLRKFRVDLVLDQTVDVRSLKPKKVDRELTTNPMSDEVKIDPSGDMLKQRDALSEVPTDQ